MPSPCRSLGSLPIRSKLWKGGLHCVGQGEFSDKMTPDEKVGGDQMVSKENLENSPLLAPAELVLCKHPHLLNERI